MNTPRRALPLVHLEVFEAAARAGSFTQAGRDLGMSQAAVSYAVARLEDGIGVQLFARHGRRVGLTDAGAALFGDVTRGLQTIRRSVASLQQAVQPGKVLLSVSSAFATFWMMPRLTAFRARFPDIDLHLRAVDRDIDIAAERIALGVRYGPGVQPNYHRALLAREAIRPVCSPGYATRHGLDTATPPAALARLALIHLDEPYRPCPTWADWFAAHAVAFADGEASLRLNDYTLAIQAALAGQGVALGWRHLVDPLLERGVLVALAAQDWRTAVDYFVVWSGALSSDAARVRDWLLAEAGAPLV